jgi:hypothetical protein
MVEDVGPETHWRGQADTSSKRVRWLLLVSVLVHTPLTPLMALVGLFGWLSAPNEAPIELPPITAIPVDIFEEETPPPAAPEPPPPDPAPVPAPTTGKATPKVVKAEPTDRGVDAGVEDAGPVTDAGTDASADAGTLGDGGVDGGIAEPVALSGDARKVVDPNANVRVTVFTEKIRAHPLGARVGRLLGSVYQWKDFFGPAAIDPIRDVDRILIVGPEFRDSAGVVAVLKLNLPPAKIRAALEAIVKGDPQGEWLDAGIPAARAHADRAPRVFVLPAPGIVVVTPPSAERSALSLGKRTGIRPAQGDEVALAYVIKPSNLTRRNPIIQLPSSLRWLRARLTPDDKGGGTIDVEALDESPEQAETNAKALARQLMAEDLRLWALQFPGSRLVERADLHADGATIRGSIYVGPAWVQSFMNLAETFLVEQPPRPAK